MLRTRFEAEQGNRSWVVRVGGLVGVCWTREILRLRGGEGWQNWVSALGRTLRRFYAVCVCWIL